MTQWLLAAEADKIQDFIFRSSRLVQVVGGSGLLSRFCVETPEFLLQRLEERHQGITSDIIIADGGSFLIRLDDEAGAEKKGKGIAEELGRELAEVYYRTTDSTLTVAEPQAYEEGGYLAASEKANADLRAKKTDRHGAAKATAQLPYTAVCASCGISLAYTRAKRFESENEKEMALCQACQHKTAERELLRQHPEREHFLSRFREALQDTQGWGNLPEAVREDLNAASARSFSDLLPSDADDVGVYDPRNYVAYIVADGNNMGVLFGQCQTPKQTQSLSNSLSQATWTALAEATTQLVQRLWRPDTDRSAIPVTPLIVGGDDLFALVPAPYSLAVAQQLCLSFEQAMKEAVKQEKFDASTPTMSAAVVICKQNYPYALAHRRGEALLNETKELVRAAQLEAGVRLSAVNFVVVRGGDVDAPATEERRYIQPSLRPYWVHTGSLPHAAEAYARPLKNLLGARYELRSLPGKRRAELRHLFRVVLPKECRTLSRTALEAALMGLRGVWRGHFETLLRRIDSPNLGDVLSWLGDSKRTALDYPWTQLKARHHQPLAHGLPDVLETWHFAQNLAHDLEEYEE